MKREIRHNMYVIVVGTIVWFVGVAAVFYLGLAMLGVIDQDWDLIKIIVGVWLMVEVIDMIWRWWVEVKKWMPQVSGLDRWRDGLRMGQR